MGIVKVLVRHIQIIAGPVSKTDKEHSNYEMDANNPIKSDKEQSRYFLAGDVQM